ncbi:hypothetical protein Glove_131g32 [Diversispora epigaea]|uniref:Uncharacterized protein n=1 Tax=Diversispora epigaea TaxID=1348612 RepID=A0A397IXZ4_9GLOM|nr:hypothetical protein Glove_131g32 [Diversispora epigaea]
MTFTYLWFMITNIFFCKVFEKIGDDDEALKQCIAEITLRLAQIKSMTDANEATRCTFIESILHASIAIARRETNKEIDTEYRRDISGEETSGRVDYAISGMEDLLCIIVSTGVDWHFIMFTSDGLYCTSKTEYQIDLTKKVLRGSRENLRDSIKQIIGIIVGLLKDRAMACDEPENKRRRVQEKIGK